MNAQVYVGILEDFLVPFLAEKSSDGHRFMKTIGNYPLLARVDACTHLLTREVGVQLNFERDSK